MATSSHTMPRLRDFRKEEAEILEFFEGRQGALRVLANRPAKRCHKRRFDHPAPDSSKGRQTTLVTDAGVSRPCERV